jgi:hypothetical protein
MRNIHMQLLLAGIQGLAWVPRAATQDNLGDRRYAVNGPAGT